MENNYLNLVRLLKKTVYHLVREEKYSISFLCKEWIQQKKNNNVDLGNLTSLQRSHFKFRF